MSNIFIIGSTGGVGSRLAPKLISAGHQVTGLHRQPEDANKLSQAGVTPTQGDIMEMIADDLATASKHCDTFVFSAGAAGSGQDRTSAIDGEGVRKMITAAQEHNIKRIYLVSVFMDAGRASETSDGFEHYMAVKREADIALTESGLDWLIVRPGRLVDDEGNGKVNAGYAIPYGTVARGNVASVLAELINQPQINHKIIELTDGETPVAEAVSQFH